MNLERLDWDSSFFGLSVGKLVIAASEEFDPDAFKDLAAAGGYDLIYVFALQRMLALEQTLPSKLDLVDIQLTMSQSFQRERFNGLTYAIRKTLSADELHQCYVIAEQTAKVSRFYREPLIGPDMTRQLYRQWVDNSLNTTFSDGLFLVKESDSVIGIHLVKTELDARVGRCSVIGVEASSKRLNVGRRLWDQAFGYWAAESNIESCKVPFSLQNTESLNFHLKVGFNRVEEIKYIYHFRSKDKR